LNLFEEQCAADYTKNHELYDDFYYKANSWKKPLRVICKVERALGELLPRDIFCINFKIKKSSSEHTIKGAI
jgi:hypothetical protein